MSAAAFPVESDDRGLTRGPFVQPGSCAELELRARDYTQRGQEPASVCDTFMKDLYKT